MTPGDVKKLSVAMAMIESAFPGGQFDAEDGRIKRIANADALVNVEFEVIPGINYKITFALRDIYRLPEDFNGDRVGARIELERSGFRRDEFAARVITQQIGSINHITHSTPKEYTTLASQIREAKGLLMEDMNVVISKIHNITGVANQIDKSKID